MSVTVQINRAHLEARFNRGREACGPILARQILDDCNNWSVPDDGEGTLKASGRSDERPDADFAATWNTVYAKYQYYGCWPDGSHLIQDHNHTQGYTPHPSILWCEVARARYESDWNTVAQREFVRGAGG